MIESELERVLRGVTKSYDDFVVVVSNIARKSHREQDVIDFAKSHQNATPSDFMDLFLDMSKQAENKYSK